MIALLLQGGILAAKASSFSCPVLSTETVQNLSTKTVQNLSTETVPTDSTEKVPVIPEWADTPVPAKFNPDSLDIILGLDPIHIVGHKNTSPVTAGKDNLLTVDMDLMESMPKFLGNTDPVQILRYMPGVQTVSEFDSGINIQGCDDAHNDISIGGVPIYGTNHLFGFFSVFNPSHYSKFDFEKSFFGVDAPNRIGASINMRSNGFEKEKVTGKVDLGLMSAQGTLSWRMSKKTQLHVSARQSYMNLLYKRFMKFDRYPIRYGFGDYNLTFLYRPSDADNIVIEGYFGRDRARVADPGQGMFYMNLGWGNYSASIRWDHEFNGSRLEQQAYVTSHWLNADIEHELKQLQLPSSINSYAYKAKWKNDLFKAGVDVIWHHVHPQNPVVMNSAGPHNSGVEHQSGLEADAFFGYANEFNNGVGVNAGVRGVYYLDPERKSHGAFSPTASVYYDSYSYGRFTLSYAWQHQFLFKTGLPNMGLPFDFWFMAGRYSSPQGAHSFNFSYNVDILDNLLHFDVSTYVKYLTNQVEYNGNVLDFFDQAYTLDKYLLKGNGLNYGLNFMVQKTYGRFTGWISYSLGRSLRQFIGAPDLSGDTVEPIPQSPDSGIPGGGNHPHFPLFPEDGHPSRVPSTSDSGYSSGSALTPEGGSAEGDAKKWYPSNHERIHELNIVLSYKIGRWDLSTSFVCASGLPFTPPDSFYITSGQIITSYGEYNSCRMRPYLRLDLSANFKILEKNRHRLDANASLFNAFGYRNDIMYALNLTDTGFNFQAATFHLRFVPSVSLSWKF